MNKSSNRKSWVDVARIMALFAVYMTHTGPVSGFAYSFGFKFAVQTFFLISGCMAIYDKEENYFKYVWKKFKALIIPYFMFAALAIIIKLVMTNRGFDFVRESLIIVLKGCIRNQFYSAPLWYFTCAFLIEIIFKLFRYIKVRFVPLLLSVVTWGIAVFALPHNPVAEPCMLFNADSAMYYMIFYGVGYAVYPLLVKLMELSNVKAKMVFGITGLVSLAFSVLVFLEHDPFAGFMDILYISDILIIIRSLIIIYSVLVAARLFDKVEFMSKFGKETLYLCGNEMIIKTLFQTVLEMIGLGIVIANPLSAYIYCICCFVFGYYIIVRFEKSCASSVLDIFNKAKQ